MLHVYFYNFRLLGPFWSFNPTFKPNWVIMGNCFKSHSNQSDKRFGLCMTYYCCFSDSELDGKSDNGSDDTPIEEMCDILPFYCVSNFIAEVFYGANYRSTIITSKNTSKNLSFCCFQGKKCIKMPSLFTLLRFFDELFF